MRIAHWLTLRFYHNSRSMTRKCCFTRKSFYRFLKLHIAQFHESVSILTFNFPKSWNFQITCPNDERYQWFWFHLKLTQKQSSLLLTFQVLIWKVQGIWFYLNFGLGSYCLSYHDNSLRLRRVFGRRQWLSNLSIKNWEHLLMNWISLGDEQENRIYSLWTSHSFYGLEKFDSLIRDQPVFVKFCLNNIILNFTTLSSESWRSAQASVALVFTLTVMFTSVSISRSSICHLIWFVSFRLHLETISHRYLSTTVPLVSSCKFSLSWINNWWCWTL
jgi:hypothetical protein